MPRGLRAAYISIKKSQININNMAKKKVNTEIDKKRATKNSANNERQASIVIGTAVGLLVFLAIIVLIMSMANSFKYLGLDFKKEKYGSMIIYSANIPIIGADGKVTSYISLDLKNDPRMLKDITVNISGEIRFLNNVDTYISMNPRMESCEDNGVAVVGLGVFFSRTGIPVKAAFTNKTYATETKYPYITCKNATTNTVIIVDNGNSTGISEPAENCYKIEYSNCEVLQVIEKFQLTVVEQYVKSLE